MTFSTGVVLAMKLNIQLSDTKYCVAGRTTGTSEEEEEADQKYFEGYPFFFSRHFIMMTIR
jgi:hypothetical protein